MLIITLTVYKKLARLNVDKIKYPKQLIISKYFLNIAKLIKKYRK